MRKLYLFMLMFCGLFLCGQAAQAQTSYVLSQETYTESSADGQTYNFNNGFSVSNEAGKAYGKGKENTIKYTQNKVYTIHIPDGITISKVTFEGYDNYAGIDAFVKELNGTTYEETQYVFPQKDGDGNYTKVTKSIDLTTPATGTLTFTMGGKQCCLIITLETPAATNIQNATVASKNAKTQKYLDKGKVVIEKAGKKFNAAGQQLK
jgi:hypothetical protein